MKIYFDTCSLQRPLDDKTKLRIAIEAEVMIHLLQLCEDEKIQLISSEILIYEIEKITNQREKNLACKF
jgi:hypothetical protein